MKGAAIASHAYDGTNIENIFSRWSKGVLKYPTNNGNRMSQNPQNDLNGHKHTHTKIQKKKFNNNKHGVHEANGRAWNHTVIECFFFIQTNPPD